MRMEYPKVDSEQFKDYSRLSEPPEGKEECFFCSAVRDKDKMKKAKMYDTIIYICERC